MVNDRDFSAPAATQPVIRSTGTGSSYVVTVTVREDEHERIDVDYLVEYSTGCFELTYQTHRVHMRSFRGVPWSTNGREYRAEMDRESLESYLAVGLVAQAITGNLKMVIK